MSEIIDNTTKEELIYSKPKIGRPKAIKTPEEILKETIIEASPRLGRKPIPESITKTKEYIKEYHKNYYEQNKEKFLADVYCDICKVRYSKSNRSRHCKNRLHIRCLENFNNENNLITNLI